MLGTFEIISGFSMATSLSLLSTVASTVLLLTSETTVYNLPCTWHDLSQHKVIWERRW
jgi:hypothetical protein